jgi:Tfp pilus assembly protein PilV
MKKNAHGFSLLEALITLLVLNVGLLGLGQLQARLWAGAGDLHTLADAYMLGENLLEISPLTWLPATTEQNLLAQSQPAIDATLNQPDPDQGNSPLVTTAANLHWRRPSGEHSLSLSTSVNTGLAARDTRWLLPWN